MDISKLTAKELRDLADQKEAEENKAKKEGFLNQDLYSYEDWLHGLPEYRFDYDFWLFSQQEMTGHILNFQSKFKPALKKGTRFVCFLDKGRECWYDGVNYGVEDLDSEWAAKYLEGIREI